MSFSKLTGSISSFIAEYKLWLIGLMMIPAYFYAWLVITRQEVFETIMVSNLTLNMFIFIYVGDKLAKGYTKERWPENKRTRLMVEWGVFFGIVVFYRFAFGAVTIFG